MHGDSASHFDADALDRAWDDLVRGGEGGEYPELAATVHDLSALIPAPAGGARDRVWRRLAPAAVSRAAGRRTLRIALVPQPLPPALAQPRRWFSSPKLALEGLLACLLIATLAFAITSQHGNNGQRQSYPEPAIRGGQSTSVSLNLIPGADLRPVQVAVFEVTIAPASTWYGLDDAALRPPIDMAVTVLSGELYTDTQNRLEPFRAGENAGPATFLRNNDPDTPLVVQLVLLQVATAIAPASTRNTIVTPIFATPVERPGDGVRRTITVATGAYTGSTGQRLDHLTDLDGDAVRVMAGSIEVESVGDTPVTVGDAVDSSSISEALATGARTQLDVGEWVAFTGVDRAPVFRFVNAEPVTLLIVSSHNSSLQRAYVTTQPQQVIWTGAEMEGSGGIILRQLTMQGSALLHDNYTGLTFFRVISGVVMIVADDNAEVILTPGETYSANVAQRLRVQNNRNSEAVVIQGSVFSGTDFEHAWGDAAQSSGVVRERLAIVPITLPAGPLSVDFSWLDAESIDGASAVNGTQLLVNLGDAISIEAQTPGVALQSGDFASLESIAPDTLADLARGDSAELGTGEMLLASAGAIYRRSAEPGSSVLAYVISIQPASDVMPGYSPRVATPQPTMDPWHLRDLRDQVVPASTTWTGGISEGKVYLALSEIVFPTGTGFVNDAMSQPSIYLLAVMQGSVTVTVDDQAPQTLTAGESASFLVIRRAEVRNSGPGEASIIQAVGWPGYVIPVASPTPAAATPTPEYYGYFLANAVVELPADQVAIRLEIADETTVSRTAGSDGYTLINAIGGPISLQVTTGTVGIRNDQPTRDEYLQGTGFNPISLGATAIIGYNTVLAEPGSAYTLAATPGDQILAVLLSIAPAE